MGDEQVDPLGRRAAAQAVESQRRAARDHRVIAGVQQPGDHLLAPGRLAVVQRDDARAEPLPRLTVAATPVGRALRDAEELELADRDHAVVAGRPQQLGRDRPLTPAHAATVRVPRPGA